MVVLILFFVMLTVLWLSFSVVVKDGLSHLVMFWLMLTLVMEDGH